MPRYAQLVMGPAGSGKVTMLTHASELKANGFLLAQCDGDGVFLSCVSSFQSTYCSTMVQHCETLGRSVQVVNLDPAAEHFEYPVMAGGDAE